MRELFIYWKTAAATAESAEREALTWQDELRQAFPGLHASLYRRADESPAASATITLMETYAGAAMDGGLERRIADEGDARLGRWLTGPRKVETFVRSPRG